jgi:hypothetical protein
MKIYIAATLSILAASILSAPAFVSGETIPPNTVLLPLVRGTGTAPTATQTPTGTPAATQTATATPTATETPTEAPTGSVEVSGVTHYDTDSDWADMIGLVTNNTTSTVDFVQVGVALFMTDTFVYGREDFIEINPLPAGDVSSFQVPLHMAEEWNRYQIFVDHAEDAGRELIEIEAFDISTAVNEFGYVQILGQVRNTSQYELSGPRSIADLFDADGGLVGVGSAYTFPSTLPVDALGYFQITISHWKNKPVAPAEISVRVVSNRQKDQR